MIRQLVEVSGNRIRSRPIKVRVTTVLRIR
jgi:hypothetical protein